MATPKNLFTLEVAQKLHQAVGLMIAATVCSLPLILVSFSYGPLVGLALAAGGVCMLIGLNRVREVTGTMVESLGGVTNRKMAAYGGQDADYAPRPPAAVYEAPPVTAPRPARTVVEPPVAVYARSASAPKKKSAPPKPATPVIDWEEWVGQKLLQKIGIVIVLLGMLVLLQQAFENRWIDELGRVFLALLGSALMLGAGEYFNKKYPQWSHGFTGGGLALAYLAVWVAHVMYADQLALSYGLVIPAGVAFFLYSIITAVGALLAVRYNAQTIAWFAIAGGYLTPLLVEAAEPDPYVFSAYLGILAAGLLALSAYRTWQGISLVAFFLTQFYLATSVYPSDLLPNHAQAIVAVAFFVVFAALPLVRHFRFKTEATPEDLCLIIANAVATFLVVQDALGGWQSEWVTLLCIALAAFTIACSVLALRMRREDAVLGDTYLLGSIALIALALYHQLGWEWLALGWAPYAALTMHLAASLKRRSVWGASNALLAVAIASLVTQMPITPVIEASWRPFLSNWSLQAYVMFASLLAMLPAVRKIPKDFTGDVNVDGVIHAMIAILSFGVITFEVTALQWVSSVPLSLAYLAFATVAVAVFMATRQIVWFATALTMQVIVFIFAFLRGDGLGMDVLHIVNRPTMLDYADFPIVHPWALVSLLSTLSLIGLLAVSARGPEHPMLPRIQLRHLLLGMIVAQVWLHVSVEIQHLASYFDWSFENYQRVLSAWWLLVAGTIAHIAWTRQWREAAVLLLLLPFGKDLVRTVAGNATMADSIAWTLVALAVASYGAYFKRRELLVAGVVGLIGTEAADILRNVGGDVDIVRRLWWPIIAAIAARAAWTPPLRKAVVVLFALPFASDMLRILAGDAAMPDAIGWTLVALVFASYGVYSKKREFLVAGVAGLLATGAIDMLTHFSANDAGLLRSVWWAITGLLTMIAGFAFRDKLLRQASLGIFAATVAKLLLVDFGTLETPVRIIASIATGLLLIGASYLYQRFGTPQGEKQ